MNHSFETLQVSATICKALKEEGYTHPTPIQEQAIPIVLSGQDLLGCAQTGTGKTAAFAIPILQLLSGRKAAHPQAIRALIVTPTRELAIQIGESFATYGKYCALRHAVIFGGVGQRPQEQAIRRGTDVLIATPGRLLDLIQQGIVSLQNIEIFVLDEADRMLDMGFIHDIRKLLPLLPAKRQSLFFSATMPEPIRKLAAGILTRPKEVAVTPVSSTAEKVQQKLFYVDRANKLPLLIDILKSPDIKTALVFTRTKHGADKVTRVLNKHGIRAEAIHGNKLQNARQRALQNFKTQATRVLVATDIAARGIDVDQLEHVINFEVPNVPETYVHRIGRTGRAGSSGTAYSFCDGEEKAYIRDIEKLTKIRIPVVDDHAYPMGHPVEMKAGPHSGQLHKNNLHRNLEGGNASGKPLRPEGGKRMSGKASSGWHKKSHMQPKKSTHKGEK